MVKAGTVSPGLWQYDSVRRLPLGVFIYRNDALCRDDDSNALSTNDLREVSLIMDEPGALQLLGSESFRTGEWYRVVTFLNQCLKDRGLVFGLVRAGDEYSIRIYQGRADDPAVPVTDDTHR